jgi:RimJ/RimL family protein N-acetyltransferase
MQQNEIPVDQKNELMSFNLQPHLENDQVMLQPLQKNDFEALYTVAADPKIWEQHPNKDRWKREIFMTFFEGAIQSGGAFKIVEKKTGNIAGSTRIYDPDKAKRSVLVGYTFYATEYWGTGINISVKKLMLDYLFQFVEEVRFHIGAVNKRSQIAITRLGAEKVAEEELAYYGESTKLNFIYSVRKEDWLKRS